MFQVGGTVGARVVTIRVLLQTRPAPEVRRAATSSLSIDKRLYSYLICLASRFIFHHASISMFVVIVVE